MPYSVVAAGTTHNSVSAFTALLDDRRFNLEAVITPSPKPVGRKQILTKNPAHTFAEKLGIPAALVSKKISLSLKSSLDQLLNQPPDFLLVVDFGYIIPDWLLALPKVAPINIHPSDLPRWRGSSPGQFTLLYGETESAVTIIEMNEKLDHGPIIAQKTFAVVPNWSSSDYYTHSFELVKQLLPDSLVELAEGKIKPQAQPDDSPTPIAAKLKKQDAFIEWEAVEAAMTGETVGSAIFSSSVIRAVSEQKQNLPEVIESASRAFSPWPQLWTLVPTASGKKRMKIIEAAAEDGVFQLKTVQIEGQNPAQWNQVKNGIQVRD